MEEQNELEIPRTRGRVKRQDDPLGPASEPRKLSDYPPIDVAAHTPAPADKPYMTVKLFVRKHLNGDAFWNPNGDALAAPQDVEPGVAVTLKAHRARELIAKGAAVAV